jgi:hypothetical protein
LVAHAALDVLSGEADQRPVVAIVDDLHWLDPASRAAVGFVGRWIEPERIVLLAALRDGYEEEIGALNLPELVLRGLARDHALELLDRRAGGLSQAVRERLLEDAAGNPLALVELPTTATADAAPTAARDTILPLSARLERAFASRLQDVPEDTRVLLLIAAADEAGTLDEILAAGELTTGHPVSDASLEPAVDAGLIEVAAQRVAFRHPLVRSAIYQSADIEGRVTAHSALARVLTYEPDRRALHRAAATIGQDDEVANEVEEMASRAQNRGAVMEAALLLGRAAELSTDVEFHVRRVLGAGELAFQVGRADLVQGFVRDARRFALDGRDSARVELLSEIFFDGVAGDVARVRSLAALARQVGAGGDVGLALELLKGASLRCWWSAMDAEVRGEVLAAADELAVPPWDPRLLAIVAIVAPIEREADVSRRVKESMPRTANDPPLAQLLGIAAHAVGDHETAMRILVPVADTMREHGRLGLLAQVLSMLQWDAIMLGEWALAGQAAAEGDRLARETGQRVWGAGLTCGLAVVAAIRGDEERAEALAAEAESVIIPHRLVDMHCVLLTARGITALSSGRYGHAHRLLARVMDPDDPAHHYREQFGAVTFLADAAVMCHRIEAARAIVENLAAVSEPSTAPALRFSLEYAGAVLAPEDEAERRHVQLLSRKPRLGQFDRGRLLLSYARFLRRRGRNRESGDAARAAREAFEGVEATSWRRAAEELRAAGEE